MKLTFPKGIEYAWVSINGMPAEAHVDLGCKKDPHVKLPDDAETVRVACFVVKKFKPTLGGIPEPAGNAAIAIQRDDSKNGAKEPLYIRGRSTSLKIVLDGAIITKNTKRFMAETSPAKAVAEIRAGLRAITRPAGVASGQRPKASSAISLRVECLDSITRKESLHECEPPWPLKESVFVPKADFVESMNRASKALAMLLGEPFSSAEDPAMCAATLIQMMVGPYRRENSKKYDDWTDGAFLFDRNRDCEDMAATAVQYIDNIFYCWPDGTVSAADEAEAPVRRAIEYVVGNLERGKGSIALCLADPNLALAGLANQGDSKFSGHAFAVWEQRGSSVPWLMEATTLCHPLEQTKVAEVREKGYSKLARIDPNKYHKVYATIGSFRTDGVSLLLTKTGSPPAIGVLGQDFFAGNFEAASHLKFLPSGSAGPIRWTEGEVPLQALISLKTRLPSLFSSHKTEEPNQTLRGCAEKTMDKDREILMMAAHETVAVSKKVRPFSMKEYRILLGSWGVGIAPKKHPTHKGAAAAGFNDLA